MPSVDPFAVFTSENSVWHEVSLSLREILQRSDDGSLLVDRLQSSAQWKLQVKHTLHYFCFHLSVE